MEKISWKTLLVGIGGGILASLVSGFILDTYQQFPQADFDISINSMELKNSTTFSTISIQNTGQIAAKNVVVILNPSHDIVDFTPGLKMEKFKIIDNGPRSLLIELPRLSNGAKISINNILNTTYAEKGPYQVYVSSDQGATIYREPTFTDDLILSGLTVVIGILVGAILSILHKQHIKKHKDDYKIYPV